MRQISIAWLWVTLVAVASACSTTLDAANLQFTDFTVNAGVTLTVPSGTVIRCTGTFTNNGKIVLQTGALGGFHFGGLSANAPRGQSVPNPGVGIASASAGADGDPSGGNALGGKAGVGLTPSQARSIRFPGVNAGGCGAGGLNDIGFPGGAGGGSLVVLAKVAIVSAGDGIAADGDSAFTAGGGGGGGGVIILASPGSITQSAVLTAKGGAGASNDDFNGRGGGGGGGLIRLVSPSILNTGSTDVSGGAAGTLASATPSAFTRVGGAGGGAGAGNGGVGGVYGAVAQLAGAGGTGLVLADQVDPTALF